jgi:hypothetical protein
MNTKVRLLPRTKINEVINADQNGGIEYNFVLETYDKERAIIWCSHILKSVGIKHVCSKESIYISMNQEK